MWVCSHSTSTVSAPVHSHQFPKFGFKHWVIGSCGGRREGRGDGPSPGLTAESKQLWQIKHNTWVHSLGYRPRALSNPPCTSGQITLSLHICFPTPSLSMRHWALMTHCGTAQCVNFGYKSAMYYLWVWKGKCKITANHSFSLVSMKLQAWEILSWNTSAVCLL